MLGVQNKDGKDMKQLSEKENIRFAVVAIALLIFSASAIYVSATQKPIDIVYVETYQGYDIFLFPTCGYVAVNHDSLGTGTPTFIFGSDLPDLRGDIDEANR